jgi:hypothetical protein
MGRDYAAFFFTEEEEARFRADWITAIALDIAQHLKAGSCLLPVRKERFLQP